MVELFPCGDEHLPCNVHAEIREVFSELRGLILKTAGLVDVLAQALKPLSSKLQLVFVYGSIANGTAQSDSDIDLIAGAIGEAGARKVLWDNARAFYRLAP